MGLLTDPSSTKDIGAKINKFGSKLSTLGFLCGIGWLAMQSSAQFNARTYIDENALQPRMASPKYSQTVKGLAGVMNRRMEDCVTADCRKNLIKKAATTLRLKYEEQSWSYSDLSSSNIIVRVCPIGSSAAESIIINVPIASWDEKVTNSAFGTGMALMSMISDQTHWGKDIFFIFSTHGRRGIQCWLENNFENKNKECEGPELELSAASPQTGVVLKGDAPTFSFVNVEMEGDNGQMTNQDIVGVIKYLYTTASRNIRWFQQFTTLRYPNRFAPLEPAEIQRVTGVKRKTLVLDLDETLIHSQHDGLGRGGPARSTKTSDFILNVVIDSHPVSFYVYKRPHVDYFLQTVSQWYDLVVFTASMEVYGSAVCDKLDPHKTILRRRYYRQDCRMEYHSYTKDLATVNSDLSSVFILDNSPGAYRHYVENAVPIKSWFSDPHDTCLLNLLPMLDALSSDQCEMTNDSGDIFVGIVTALDADFGFIDGTIFFTKSVCENQILPTLNASVRYTAKSRHDMPMKKIATCVIASNNLQVSNTDSSSNSPSPPLKLLQAPPNSSNTTNSNSKKPILKREFEEPGFPSEPQNCARTSRNSSSRDEYSGNARVDRFREPRELPQWGHSREETFDQQENRGRSSTNGRVKIERITDQEWQDRSSFIPFDPTARVKTEPGEEPQLSGAPVRVKLERIDDEIGVDRGTEIGTLELEVPEGMGSVLFILKIESANKSPSPRPENRERNRENYEKKLLHGSVPKPPPAPVANKKVISAPTDNYSPLLNFTEKRESLPSLEPVREEFQALSQRHTAQSDSTWQAPKVLRRKRAAILSGTPENEQDEFSDVDSDDDNGTNLLICEDDLETNEENGNEETEAATEEETATESQTVDGDTLNDALEEAADGQEDTIGYQVIKEFRKDLEKAGVFGKSEKKKRKSLLQGDTKKILNKAGELIKYIRTIKNHPDRMCAELWYNEPKMANDGPLCKCEMDQQHGINHGVYPQEIQPPALPAKSNNLDKLFHYRITVSPLKNFAFKDHITTKISYNNKTFRFAGYSIFSHRDLSKVPTIPVTRYHNEHAITLLPEPAPTSFCLADLELFSDFFFKDTLELYDWIEGLTPSNDPSVKIEPGSSFSQKFFYFLPRFESRGLDNQLELLGMDQIMQYFIDSNKPLIEPNDLVRFHPVKTFRGQLVTNPGKKPSTIRLDQLDREKTMTGAANKEHRWPIIVHFGVRPANLSYAGDPVYQKVYRTYQKYRHLITNKPRIQEQHWSKIRDLEVLLQKMRRMADMQREVTNEISCENFRLTVFIPIFRYIHSLDSLQTILGYRFKNLSWLTRAMTHPSAVYNYGENPDHVRNSTTNCGIRKPQYGEDGPSRPYERKRGIVTLIKVMALLGTSEPKESPINYLERPEFLGDAVLGFIVSVSIFHLFPHLGEGALSMLRCALVCNVHLAALAQKLTLEDYFVYIHSQDLAKREDLNNALANCFEAVLGAIYMDGGLEPVRHLLARVLFDDESLQRIWLNFPAHPLQQEFPDGDRAKIESSKVLKRCAELENLLGLKFKNIRLLAKALTLKNVKYNDITKGHNQRLEFLDQGIIAVDVFMKVCFYPRLKHFIMSQVWNDPKSCLQQCCLTLRPEEGSPDLPEYRHNSSSTSSSKMRYRVEVYFRGERIGEEESEECCRSLDEWLKEMPLKNFYCLGSKNHRSKRSQSPLPNYEQQLVPLESLLPEEIKGSTTVRLVKDSDEPLGLTIAGGLDKLSMARVEHLRAGGLASRCDLLQVGDIISSVNGINTSRLKHDDIINLLKNVGNVLNLGIDYELPPTFPPSPHQVQKIVTVNLPRDDVPGSGRGIVLRGGVNKEDPMKTRPLVVSFIRPGSLCDANTPIKVGDRMVAAGNNRLDSCTLDEALAIIDREEVFTVQYSAQIVDQVQNAKGPLSIEVAKPPGSNLGVNLSVTVINHRHVIVISEIVAASIADRCGALHVGDQVIRIDGHHVEQLTLDDATRLLSSPSDQIKLEILPVSHVRLSIEGPKSIGYPGRYTPSIGPGTSYSHLNTGTFSRSGTMLSSKSNTFSRMRGRKLKSGLSQMSVASFDPYAQPNQVNHQETFCRTLECEPRTSFGINISAGVFATCDFMGGPKLIESIDEGSAADEAAVFQAGDRILRLNDVPLEEMGPDEANQMLMDSADRGRVKIEVEFDIADAVVPTSGEFTLKLHRKSHQSLGIEVSAPRNRIFGEPLAISNIIPGSVAHRTGSLAAGDKLLAINNHKLDHCTISDAIQLLKNTGELVRLKIRKEDEEETGLCFTVELKGNGGPLGITITGSDDPFDPIYVSNLTPGGIAERTRAIQKGDKILSINGTSCKTKTLQQCIELMRSSDVLKLKIEKDEMKPSSSNQPLSTGALFDERIAEEASDNEQTRFQRYHTPNNKSHDSAVESWESGNSELSQNSSSNHGKARQPNSRNPNFSSHTLGNPRHRASERRSNEFGSLARLPGRDRALSDRHIPQRNFESMDNISARRLPRSRSQDSRRMRASSRFGSRDGSRDRALGRERRNEIRNIDLEEKETRSKMSRARSAHRVRDVKHRQPHLYQEEDRSSDESNWEGNTNSKQFPERAPSETSEFLDDVIRDLRSVATAGYKENLRAIVFKDLELGTFGFSVSDGVDEQGVFVNSIKPDGPAARAGVLPFDRILQINNIRCNEMQSQAVLAAIQQSGNRLRLQLSRNPASGAAMAHQT
ncbi:Oidioi.mRNA.OKI2018_I69.chr2.g6007.t2.cds [Oikopleura dioica]|uniref:Oidioi.mRNA.OKI2018_I69.chr2.g6007.t2.cds n=1 Tax=Oikopleura dioica TaxID=34765 RepID=A0ABN7T3V8_OIKDI|nr:Oidioi.mRNA.OKI2018_I69.chr2.g6007.t2.cds [Oikopleura dioica]